MTIELVLFGFLGTTVADEDVYGVPLRAVLASAGVAVDDGDLASVAGLSSPDAVRALLEDGAPRAEAERLHDDLVRRIVARASAEAPVREVLGVSQAFWQLRREGLQIGSLTGLSMTAAGALHDRLGWRARGLVDVCVTSDEVERGAPFPDAVRETMDRAGVRDPARVVFVASTVAELRQGSAAGCGLVVGVFESGGGSFERLRGAPHNVLLPTCALVPELLRRIGARRMAPISFGWSAP